MVAVLCSTPGERDLGHGGVAGSGEFLYRLDDGLVQHMAGTGAELVPITEASQVIRVLPTGSLRSPGLHEVADALGLEKSGTGPAPPPVCSPA